MRIINFKTNKQIEAYVKRYYPKRTKSGEKVAVRIEYVEKSIIDAIGRLHSGEGIELTGPNKQKLFIVLKHDSRQK
jgi:hypothetical protein